jgi:branched-chain amino acid aminotransferase
MKSEFIWIDGELIPYENATVHFLSPALHYGLAAFEGIRCYNTSQGPGVFRLEEHLERFINSGKILGLLDFPYSVENLREAVHTTIRANQFAECYIRPLLYMSTGPLGLNLDDQNLSVGIATWEWGAYLGEEAREKGTRMMISSFSRLHPNTNMTKAKISGNYPNSVLAKTLAKRSGFDEAIMLDPDGYVAEGSGENIFVIRKGVIYTPPTAGILEGITRDSVITIAKDLGYQVSEERITRDQLYIADEVFVTGTAAEVVAVCEIDTRIIGEGKMGSVTRSIQNEFHQIIHGKNTKYDKWVDLVTEAEFSFGI